MKRLKRGLIGIAVVIFAVFGFILLIAWVHRDELAGKVREEINTYLNADLQMGKYRVTIFRHFPDVELIVEDVVITGRGEFTGDTLTVIRKLGIEVDFYSLFRGPLTVESLYIDRGMLLAKVLPDGRANWDIWIDSEDAIADGDTANAASYQIRQISFRNAEIRYEDLESDLHSTLNRVQIDLQKSGTSEYWNSRIEVSVWNASMYGFRLLQDGYAALDGELAFDADRFGLAFGENALRLNDMPFSLAGSVSMPDTTVFMDLAFSSPNSTFKQWLSLVPFMYR